MVLEMLGGTKPRFYKEIEMRKMIVMMIGGLVWKWLQKRMKRNNRSVGRTQNYSDARP